MIRRNVISNHRSAAKMLFSNGTNTASDSEKKTKHKPKKVTVPSLVSKKRHGKKISMVTAYDYPSAFTSIELASTSSWSVIPAPWLS